MVVCDSKLKEHIDFLCDEGPDKGMKGDFMDLTTSIKVFLSETAARVAKGTVAQTYM
jgi:hypothetical protein